MHNPGTPEFIQEYPFQVQVYRAYHNWREFEGANYPTKSEAVDFASDLREKWTQSIRVVDMRTGDVIPLGPRKKKGKSNG